MAFYNSAHPYYCGINLHARLLYACIIDFKNKIIVHNKIKADSSQLLALLYLTLASLLSVLNVFITGTDFVLGHPYT